MDLFKIFSTKPSPKDMAKERLKLILIHDRAHVPPEILESIREDILKVISKYFEIDNEEIDVKMAKMEELPGESPALIASIPIKKMKMNK
ncbi:cell division topological specificity factor MinE [Clostridium sp. OS1-26]|uniref:cell division topological specificity factor MinE n=1 Tax=Clostridium sp. OS1-26 TaxID=3070681 RepID=UPI0027E10CA0|nr:cell division topological specificity factor MinE [Clostridium sp. OS1-26]WML35693.1 cell division topological specificity factor MinE [Clostridium sp. OS1-26]